MIKSYFFRIVPSVEGWWVDRFFPWILRRRRLVHGLTLLVTALALFLASRLELRTDFSELLPKKLSSVVALKTASERMGGAGLLILGVESPSFAANRRFVDDFVKKIDPWVGSRLRFYEYRFSDVKSYAQKYGLHYLNLGQLDELRDYLKEQIEKRWDNSLAASLGLDSEPSHSPSTKNFDEILRENSGAGSLGAILRYPDAYLGAREGRVLAVAMRPMNSSLSIHESQKMIDEVNAVLATLKASAYHPGLHTVLAGSVPQAVEEFATIRDDIVGTSLLLVVLIFAILFVFLWSFKLIFLLVMNLVIGVLWTFALTWLHIGYLNTQTAFLGSLVVGTGINYGIIYITRFLELRRQAVSLEAALTEALRSTLLPTFIASLTTAVSFLVLLLASNQGLAQFGFIGTVGIAFCWFFAFTLIPLWIFEMEKGSRQINTYVNPLARLLKPYGLKLGEGIVRFRYPILISLVVVAVIGARGVSRVAHDPLEYNFDNVRNKLAVSSEVEAFRDRVYESFPTSMTPLLAFADKEEDARKICPAVRALKKSLPAERDVIGSCASYFDLTPEPVEDHVAQVIKFREIKELLGSRRLKFSEDYTLLKGMHDHMSDLPPKPGDIPEQILRRFREKDGRLGLFVSISPDGSKPLNDARNLINFTDSLNSLSVGEGTSKVQVAGDSFVLADLLKGIQEEGPFLTGLAFLAVAIIAVFLTGGLRNGVLMSFCLAAGTFGMLAMQGWLGLKYNFFNFIALPLTFGIGVDYPINVFIRYRQEKENGYAKIFTTTGMAVLLCASTTIIGYYTLIGAASQALAGFGKLAILGEISCLFSALVVLPIVLQVARDFRSGEGLWLYLKKRGFVKLNS